MNIVVEKAGYGFCEICDNSTPQVMVIEDGYPEKGCQYCWDAYGELN
jgi:hypothetical protein